ncbi:MAD2L1-binding protein [Esox lucius]|nr:MAD2L1-binding protein [Esox lucius]
MGPSNSQGKEINIHTESDTECNITVPSRTNDFSDEQPVTETYNPSSDETKSKEIEVIAEDKENDIHKGVSDDRAPVDGPCLLLTEASPDVTPTCQLEAGDAETLRRAREEGRVDVVFPKPVTQEGCCRFVTEILKCVLYQRQQLPMTYDQLVFTQKSQNEELSWRLGESVAGGLDWRKCQRTLQDLQEVLQQLEVLFTLSLVPRVLLLLGGSLLLPKELYEVNMEEVILAAGDRSLRVSSCLRQIFRTLFVADLLSDAKPVRLTATTVMVLAHRNCGVAWFRPRLEFKVPTRVKSKVIGLSCDPSTVGGPPKGDGQTGWKDYVWFQAPLAIKGFNK